MKNLQTFSILIWANKVKTDLNGQIPLYARVTVFGKRAEISLKKRINPRKWNAKSGLMDGNNAEARTINSYIHQVTNDIFKAYCDLQSAGGIITAEEIKMKYLGIVPVRRSLLELFDEHNQEMEQLVGKDYVKATLTKYKTIRGKVADYIIDKYQKQDVYLDTLDFGFITGFEKHLKLNDGIDHNTTMAYIKRLKKIVSLAINNQWLSFNPFTSFKCTSRKVLRAGLTDEELDHLAKKVMTIERLAEVRDAFLFCCYTGYAFVDAQQLTPENIYKTKGNEYWVKTSRQKTDIASNVPLLPPALAIIERYRNHPYCVSNNRLLPIKSNQKMNAYLKEIAVLCQIKCNLTTHIARHTFATTVTLANGVPIESVSKMLGHTKITTTQIYAKVLEGKIRADMQHLMVKLKAE